MPKPMHMLFAVFLAVALAAPAQAGTRIFMKHAEGRSEMLLTGDKVRVNPSTDGFYMLFDASEGDRLFVNGPRKQIVEMPAAEPSDEFSAADIELREKGSGPEVAGYSTTRYDVHFNGKRCGKVLASPKALADAGGDDAVRVFEMLSRQGKSGRQSQPKPCDRALEHLGERFRDIGLAMRTTKPDGGNSEILKIKSGVDLDPALFKAPEGYERRSLEEVLKGQQSQ
ncbi:hypothetical protein [Thiohalorhabdus methylotrophus]|uniref:DUF4412 domain-containing protein n=1 Tax=Thiohalorhabdus methylotrophus TaxID=3242694 RepID=A0ABV4TUX0_9GAMM